MSTSIIQQCADAVQALQVPSLSAPVLYKDNNFYCEITDDLLFTDLLKIYKTILSYYCSAKIRHWHERLPHPPLLVVTLPGDYKSNVKLPMLY